MTHNSKHSCTQTDCPICNGQLRRGKPNSQAELVVLKEKIIQLIAKSPDKAAIILASWLNSTAQNTSKTPSNVKKKTG